MKNYTDSDYALNKYSENIVYRFGNRIVEVTLANYLAENPGSTEQDFLKWKALSDAIWLDQVRDENAQTNKNVSLSELTKTPLCYVQSPEEHFVDAIDARAKVENRQQHLMIAKKALDELTDVQRRRYLLHAVEGLSTWRIAKIEGTNQKTVYESLQAAEKKIKKVLAEHLKTPPQNN